MEFSEEWKSLWPISSVFSAPLLLSGSSRGGGGGSKQLKEIGPLIFNPSPQTLTQLFTSSSLSPSIPLPYPNLSLPRFLLTNDNNSSSILPSTSSSIASGFGPQLSGPQLSNADADADAPLFHNCLQFLRCPHTDLIFTFFPTGNNSDRVGFLLLSVEDSCLHVRGGGGGGGGVDGDEGEVFTAKNTLNHRIIRLLVNPLTGSSGNSSHTTTVGYLLACTMYSLHWYSVQIRGVYIPLGSNSPSLSFMGSKLFKSCAVVHACWSPHLPEESVVLLESGELFLFDMDSRFKTRSSFTRFTGNKLRVSWDHSALLEEGRWLSCEFSWHPRILIVAHSSAVFLVDMRSEGCTVSCLLKIETLVSGHPLKDHQFVAFSRAGSDGFHFTVASNHLLLLCDVRRLLMPLLQWAHGIDNPCYITVLRLSELRSHSKDDKYKWASESGYCILMGSFRNCEFSLFCYGPDTGGSVAAEISKFCKSFYAWELPSELSLSARDCRCGSCLVREEFSKNALVKWIDWRQKKEIVLGFGILDKDISAKLTEPDSFGGFMLIRLMSSGKLESQRYRASWEFVKISEQPHKDSSLHFEDSLLYSMCDEEYMFPRKFHYLELDCLNGYLEDNLAKVLVTKMEKTCEGPHEKYSFRSEFHQHICQKLTACGLSRSGASPVVYDVFTDISVPTSIHEIALRRVWVSLPTNILRLAFSTYSEFLEVLVNQKKVSMEFLDVPDQLHLPTFSFWEPSCHSNKWSQKLQPSNVFLGPLVPLQFLVTLHKLHVEEEADGLSANLELKLQCDKVMQVANEVTMSDSGSELHNDHAVSLADDGEELCYGSQKAKLFSIHEPVAFPNKFSVGNPTPENSVCENERFTTFVYRTNQMELVSNARMEKVGIELFDTLCPSVLKFDDRAITFGLKELKIYKLLERQFSNFKESFGSYRESIVRSNFPKKNP